MNWWNGVAALRQYSFKRRLLGWKALPALLVSLIPSLVAFVYVRTATDNLHTLTPYRLYGEFLAPMCLYFVVPFVSMLTMLPVLGELYEKGAVGYLVVRPAPRWVPLFGLFQGGLLAMMPILLLAAILPAAILSTVAHGVEMRFWLQRIAGLVGVVWIGCAAYGSLCLFLGVWSRKAILWAFGLLIGWGAVAGSITGPLRSTSLHRYLFSLMREWLDIQNAWSGFYVPDPEPPAVITSILVLLFATLLFLFLAWQAIRRRDIL